MSDDKLTIKTLYKILLVDDWFIIDTDPMTFLPHMWEGVRLYNRGTDDEGDYFSPEGKLFVRPESIYGWLVMDGCRVKEGEE